MRRWRLGLGYAKARLAELEAKLGSFQRPLFLWLLALCQAATILLTWPLWQIHRAPPMLPALPLPEINTGFILLVTLAATFFRPVEGLMLHTAVLIYSLVIDQTRLQPEIVSLLILMWGSLRWYSLKTIARGHLISLWFFSGLNKLLSAGYRSSISFSHPYGAARGLGLPIAELCLAVFALNPRTRKLAAFLAFIFHLAILAALSPLRQNKNPAIWAWNLGLAFSGIALLYSWKDSPLASYRKSVPLARMAVLLILISPIGFYFGIVDAYLAHNLYSRNTPQAAWHHANGKVDTLQTMKELNVPIPPEHRLYEQYFNKTCERGDVLIIYDSRYWARLRGLAKHRLDCPR